MKSAHIQHLYNRVGFGISPKDLERLSKNSKREIVDALFSSSSTTTPLKVDLSFLKDIQPGDLKDREKRQELQKKNRQKVQDFSVAWVERIMNPTEVFREKMTLFWTNHFVCERRNNILFSQNYNNMLRANAFGNFADFTKKVSKEAAMLGYLNNKQNKKKSPNENFARELMELFTLGQGNYTETDIKESARAFTGYNHNFRGQFILRKKQHDEGEKTFFGKTGNFTGDDIIDIILQQKQCARYISTKIYRYFVNENIHQNHIEEMTMVFYKDYNIEKLMRFVLLSDWFYEAKNMGTKIKSPIEFLAGINTLVPYSFERPKQVLLIQRLLGQELMRPPNVAGWKTGRYWIDSNTLVRRLRLPSILLNNAAITYADTGDEETMLTDLKSKKLKRKAFIKTKTDWNSFEKNYAKLSNKELISFVLTSKINPETKNLLLKNRHIPKKDFCIQLLSIPEYQLC
ncbi:DUF1800 domain-containing protein [uncultured Polaribacter sp.]|uniref:DUF1800 domain-containing protein n=1 Tax=uncultured Polaribacter sp. TaxID=174711 RepID=UPI0026099F53|nr:DUF1800 domain-containing protein [uncultured Polaribacter sp.]